MERGTLILTSFLIQKCIYEKGDSFFPLFINWFWKKNFILTDFKRFPFNNFTYFLTLFSKFFSSFPHGTCSLSVSRQYLALDGIYHQIWAAFPSNPTLRKHLVRQLSTSLRGSHPLWRPFPGDFSSASCRGYFYRLQFSEGDFQVGLCAVRSPLLSASLLVSFPPLSDMLKFSG